MTDPRDADPVFTAGMYAERDIDELARIAEQRQAHKAANALRDAKSLLAAAVEALTERAA